MLFLTCTTITSEYLAHYGVSRAKDWVSVDCGTMRKGEMEQQKNTNAGKCQSNLHVAFLCYLFWQVSKLPLQK